MPPTTPCIPRRVEAGEFHFIRQVPGPVHHERIQRDTRPICDPDRGFEMRHDGRGIDALLRPELGQDFVPSLDQAILATGVAEDGGFGEL